MKHFNFLSNFRWFTSVILLTTLSVGQMWGAVTTTTFKNYSSGSWSTNKNPLPYNSGGWSWASSGTPNSFESASYARGLQWSGGTSTTLTTTQTGKTITGVSIVASTNGGSSSLAVTVGTTSFKSGNNTSVAIGNGTSYANTTYTLTGSATGQISVGVTNTTSKSVYVKSITVTYLTEITLNANGGAANKTATFDHDAAAYTSFTSCTRDGYTCTGYWTASSGGTKILNANGSLAGANITVSTVPYTSSSKWVYAGATLTLYAQWEAVASCSANPTIGAASLNGSFLGTTLFEPLSLENSKTYAFPINYLIISVLLRILSTLIYTMYISR